MLVSRVSLVSFAQKHEIFCFFDTGAFYTSWDMDGVAKYIQDMSVVKGSNLQRNAFSIVC